MICQGASFDAVGRGLAKNKRVFSSIPEYPASIDALCMDKQAVSYHEDGSVTLDF